MKQPNNFTPHLLHLDRVGLRVTVSCLFSLPMRLSNEFYVQGVIAEQSYLLIL